MLVVLGAVASFFALSSTVPQILRAFRDRSADGVSRSALLMNIAASVLWGVYSAAVLDHVMLAYNIVAIALLVLLAVALVTAEGRSCSSAVITAGFAVAVTGVAAVTVAVSPLALTVAATLLSSVRMWPQARLALARVPLWGLDPWATALGWMGWLLWAAYGLAVGDSAMTLCSVIGLVLQSIVVGFRLPPRRTLHSIAGGRLGPLVAQVAGPVSGRFPLPADAYRLVA